MRNGSEPYLSSLSTVYSAVPAATITNYPMSSLLCETGIDGGWPMVFYVPGESVVDVDFTNGSILKCNCCILHNSSLKFMGIAIPSFPRAQTNRFQRFRVVRHLLVRGAQRPRQPPAHRRGGEGVPPRRGQHQQVRAKV